MIETYLAVIGNTQTITNTSHVLFKAILVVMEQSFITTDCAIVGHELGTREIFWIILAVGKEVISFLEQLNTAKIQSRDGLRVHFHKLGLDTESQLRITMT